MVAVIILVVATSKKKKRANTRRSANRSWTKSTIDGSPTKRLDAKTSFDLLKLKRERSAADRVITAANTVHDVDVGEEFDRVYEKNLPLFFLKIWSGGSVVQVLAKQRSPASRRAQPLSRRRRNLTRKTSTSLKKRIIVMMMRKSISVCFGRC